MADLRRHIRNAAVQALLPVASFGGRIFNSRVYAHGALPAAAVYTPSDDLKEDWQAEQEDGPRELRLLVEVRAKATAGLEDDLDELDAAVEAAILGDAELAAMLMDLTYQGMERTLDAAGPVPVGLDQITFLARYGTGQAPALAAPVFSAIASEAGPSAINLGCTTDRDAIVCFRAKRLVGGVPAGAYINTTWESVPKTAGHLRQLAGLARSSTYRVWIKIDGLQDPDLDWTLFTAAGAGPDFTTTASGDDPVVPGEA